MSPTHPLSVHDDHGRQITLARELGRGGEGVVFEVAGDATGAAKIYHTAISPDKAEKIRAMVAMRTAQLEKLTAWPRALLRTAKGEARGFLMPRLTGHKDIHTLYSPKGRRVEFQNADWRFLIRTAANVARAFAVVHESGCVIGDVNHGGVTVAQDATVKLIDCDSFQVVNAERKFLCEVGVSTFTPPELQNRSLKGLLRTPNQDNFGLAVLVFLLLFMGRHPFAGRFLGASDMPIERAIQEFRFPYSTVSKTAQMEPPPGTPPLGIATHEMALLFERAFSREGTGERSRPSAREWIIVAEGLERQLRQCSDSTAHWYLRDLPQCPWCQLETSTGAFLFATVLRSPGGPVFDLDSVWARISSVQSPGPAPRADDPSLASSIHPSKELWRSRKVSIMAIWALHLLRLSQLF